MGTWATGIDALSTYHVLVGASVLWTGVSFTRVRWDGRRTESVVDEVFILAHSVAVLGHTARLVAALNALCCARAESRSGTRTGPKGVGGADAEAVDAARWGCDCGGGRVGRGRGRGGCVVDDEKVFVCLVGWLSECVLRGACESGCCLSGSTAASVPLPVADERTRSSRSPSQASRARLVHRTVRWMLGASLRALAWPEPIQSLPTGPTSRQSPFQDAPARVPCLGWAG